MEPYPSHLEEAVRLADGLVVALRPVRSDDAPMLRRELAAADPDTLYQRFFTAKPRFDDDVISYLTELDHDRRFGIVAETADEPVAIARYEALPDRDAAEIAVTVKPGWRRRGLARLLLERIVARAGERGFVTLEALCLEENQAAIDLLRGAGFEFGPAESGIRTGTMALRRRNDADATNC